MKRYAQDNLNLGIQIQPANELQKLFGEISGFFASPRSLLLRFVAKKARAHHRENFFASTGGSNLNPRVGSTADARVCA